MTVNNGAWGATEDRAPVELAQPVRLRILLAVMIGVFLAALDQTIVGTALPRIITDLGGNDIFTWAFTAYLLTATISGPIYGKLSDLYGRRPIFLLGIGIFLTGSVLAGFSTSIEWLIATRALQGLGAGALFPVALAIIGDIFSPSDRGKYQGLFGAVFGLSILIGPAIGGLLTDLFSWRLVFFVNVPVGIIAVLLVWRYLPRYHLGGDKVRIDYVGAALFTAALVPILVGLTNKQSAEWTDVGVGGLLLLGAVFLVAFVLVESRVQEPIVPLSLFRIRTFSISVVAIFLAAFGFFAAVVFLPRWFQVVDGVSATESGYQILPLLAGLIFSAVASGQIVARTGRYRWLLVVAFVTAAVGLYLLSTMDADTPIPVLWLSMFDRRPRRRADVRSLHHRRAEQRARCAPGNRDQQPDLLPAGRGHRGSGYHRHDLRVVTDRTGAAPVGGRRAAPAAGRDDGWRRAWIGAADRGRRPGCGHPRRGPSRGAGAGRAVHPGHRRRHLPGLLTGYFGHVRGRRRHIVRSRPAWCCSSARLVAVSPTPKPRPRTWGLTSSHSRPTPEIGPGPVHAPAPFEGMGTSDGRVQRSSRAGLSGGVTSLAMCAW